MGYVATGYAEDASSPEELLRSTPFVTVNYYEVQGDTPAQVRDGLRKRGPSDEQGKRRDAYTYWEIHWEWPYRNKSKADYENMQVRYQVTVTVPHWSATSSAQPELEERWREYVRALYLHEWGHVRHVLDNVGKIRSSVLAACITDPNLPPKQANQIAREILKEIHVLDRKYDKDTNHGRSQGAVFP